MPIIINDTSARAQYTATSGQTVFTVPFEFFANADLKVYINETLKTLTTHYTVTGAGVTGGGSITLVSGATAGQIVTIDRDIAVSRVTDFPLSGPFVVDDLNTELDRLTAIAQQLETKLTRAVRLDDFDQPNTFQVLPSKISRAGKIMAFDTNGNVTVGEEIGNWRGNWAVSTSYTVRDLVADSSNYNVYRVNTAHTSTGALPISTNVDAAKWDLVIDSVSAGAAAAVGAGSLAVANNLSELTATASTARTNLGLGSISTQAASSVAITGGAVNGTTVGASTPSTGAFTTLSASGTATFSGTMSATANAYMQIDALTDAATIAVDMSVGNNFSVTLAGNRTLGNPTNLNAGQSGVIFITQDGTGSRTLAYSSYWDFPAATAPTLTTTANAVDVIVYTVRSSTSIAAQAILNIG